MTLLRRIQQLRPPSYATQGAENPEGTAFIAVPRPAHPLLTSAPSSTLSPLRSRLEREAVEAQEREERLAQEKAEREEKARAQAVRPLPSNRAGQRGDADKPQIELGFCVLRLSYII